ncbi:hypothetical protein DIPPA_12375 [Diplonema papillatum]|nr:hypothetical protein DIPPA_12375 [Diplonema papillatum]
MLSALSTSSVVLRVHVHGVCHRQPLALHPHGGRRQAFAANYHKHRREAAEKPSKERASSSRSDTARADEQLRVDLLEALRGSAAARRVYGVGLTTRRARLTDADVTALMFPEGRPRRPRCVVLRSTLGGGYAAVRR